MSDCVLRAFEPSGKQNANLSYSGVLTVVPAVLTSLSISRSGISVHQVILIPPARGKKHISVATALEKKYDLYDLTICVHLTPFLLHLWQKVLTYITQQYVLVF